MASPASVVVWVVAAELASPTTFEMRDAARRALGDEVQLVVEADSPREPAPPSRDAGRVHVRWMDPGHQRAHISCYLPRSRRWVEREITFVPADPEPERGRALGLLIASLLLDTGTTESPPTPNERPAQPRLAAVSAARPENISSPPDTALAAGAEGSAPGDGAALGFWVGAEYAAFSERLWLGVALRARFGSIAVAQATTRFLAGGPELTWLIWQPAPIGRLGVRGGLFLSQLTIIHFSDDDIVPDGKSRWIPGAELALHGELDLSEAAGIFADLGGEFLAGATEVSVRHRIVTQWPSHNGLLRVGVQARF